MSRNEYLVRHHFALFGLAGLLAISAIGMGTLPSIQSDPSVDESSLAVDGLSNAERIAQMNAIELEKIRDRKRRIEQLPAAAQDRLRSIHQAWESHPQRNDLRKTMQSYYQWWKTLTIDERTRIKSVDESERMSVVQDILRERAEAVFGIVGETSLPPEDVTILFKWNREFLFSKRDQLIDLYRSRESRRGSRRFEQRLERAKQQPESLFLLLFGISSEQAITLIEPEDIQRLRSKLSDEAIAIIDAQEDGSARQKLVYRWVMSAVNAQRNPSISERELMEFYDLEMTQRQRQMVDALSPQRRRATIAQMYRARRFSRDERGFSPPFGPSR